MLPGGSCPRRSRTTCRSRRFTAVRTVARPTALLTTKPARGAVTAFSTAYGCSWPRGRSGVGPAAPGPGYRCTTSDGRPTRRPRRTAVVKSWRRRSRFPAGSTTAGSGGQARATLGAARGDDRTSGPGAHAQPEAVGLRAAAVVRLERALAHSGAPGRLVGRIWGVAGCRHPRVGTQQQPSTTRPAYGTWPPPGGSNRRPARGAPPATRALIRVDPNPTPGKGCTACGQPLEGDRPSL